MTGVKFDGDDTVPLGDGSPASVDRVSNNAGRVGPGSGDGLDSRPLGDPTAPQGTGPEVPGQATPPVELRPAPAGKVRTSWAESGDYKQ